ncbi:hypothetical protein V1294_005001 [Bradyrhizobium sp. AZCC 1678]|uniref:hypothetical protein n=1 Tax=Bradyrhizobium sp. AZCC 1678 TaxID=3117030 RepID=UPI002FEEDE5A
MVRGDDLDLDRRHQFLKILGRHPGGSDRPWSAQVGQWPGLVIDDADPDDATGEFGSAGGREGSDWCPKDQKSSDLDYRPSRVRARPFQIMRVSFQVWRHVSGPLTNGSSNRHRI